MAFNDSTKGNMIRLSTFKSWGFNMFGVKTKKMVKTNMFIKSGVKYVLQTKTRYIAIKK